MFLPLIKPDKSVQRKKKKKKLNGRQLEVMLVIKKIVMYLKSKSNSMKLVVGMNPE